MKTQVFLRSAFAGLFICMLFCGQSLFAQGRVNEWSRFVQSVSNPMVVDTFLWQTFGNKEFDNWSYQTSGKTEVFKTADEHLQIGKSEKAIRLNVGGKLLFSPFNSRHYTDITVKFDAGCKDSYMVHPLLCKAYRQEKEVLEIIKPTKDKQNLKAEQMRIGSSKGTPKGLELYHSGADGASNSGFYYVGNVCVYGKIPQYSLIATPGDWSDTLRWSNLPPARARRALVAADVVSNKSLHCDRIEIGKGSLSMNNQSPLYVNELTFHENIQEKGSYYSTGETHVSGHVRVVKELPTKGLWYFVSFPFDVYPDGLDASFALKDDTETGRGNYFYLKRYNQQKRARTGRASSNWEVISVSELRADTPILKKNTGYLLAIDEGANQTSLQFESQAASIESRFGQSGEISLTPAFGAMEADDGWCLCGNPLPGYLPLSQIERNEQIGNEVWVYNGMEYVSYSLDSNYALAPFSAFFVKAKGETSLRVKSSASSVKSSQLISTDCGLGRLIMEPESRIKSATQSESGIKIYYDAGMLYTEGLSYASELYIYNVLGVLAERFNVSRGTSAFAVSLPKGLYIILLSSAGSRDQSFKVYVNN